MRLRFVLLWLSFISTAVLATEADMTERQIPVPLAVSDELKRAITQFGIPTVQQALDGTPTDKETWLALIHSVNTEQKKKVKKMRKQYNVNVEMMNINGVTVRKIAPAALSDKFRGKVYLDVHGGAYVFFAGLPSIEEGILIAHRLGIEVISVDYRMPPHAPSPAALNDVFSVYTALLETHGAHNMFVGGTSAGGGLVLGLMQRLVHENIATPVAIYAGTPWADLSKTGDSLYINEGVDRILIAYDGVLKAAANLYANKVELNHSSVSPLYGSFEGFPPTFLLSGTRDMFLSDTVRVNRKLREVGVPTQLEVFEGISHAEYLVAYETPESVAAYAELGAFFSKW